MKQIKIRSMIIAPNNHVLISADFSQAETWIVAYLADDSNMKKSLLYGDIHTETAANIILFPTSTCSHKDWTVETGFPWKKKQDGSFECSHCHNIVTYDSRYTGKRINHGTSYRMGHEKQAAVINKDADKPPYVTVSIYQTKYYAENWKKHYCNIPNIWWPNVEEQLRKNRTLVNCYGHRMVFNGNWGDELFRTATAFEPQSTVAMHCNGAIHPELGIRGGFLEVYQQMYKKDRAIERITNISHDSIIVESRKELATENAERLVSILKRPIVLNGETFTIPVDCEMGTRWSEDMEKVKI